MNVYFGIGIVITGFVFLVRRFRPKRKPLGFAWTTHNNMSDNTDLGKVPINLAGNSTGNKVANNVANNTISNVISNVRSQLEAESFRVVNLFGGKFKTLSNDLNLVEISPSQQAYLKVRTALLSILVASFGGVYLFRFLGVVSDSTWWFVAAGIFAGVFGFIIPDKKVRELATKKRELMRNSLSAYLDLVKILLAGGSHTDGALFQAASAGNGWGFSKLKAAIDWSRVNGEPTHIGLNRLATEVGVEELEELAAITFLADKEGASLKETLTRKAELLIAKTLAETAAKSYRIAEKMSLPTVVIAMSFMAFITYPALASLTA